jgi:hypothetical protein
VNARIPDFPTRPHEGIPFTAPLGRLVEEYERHLRVVVVDRIAPVDPSADELFAHAVAALALLHTMTDRLFQARWLTVRDALAADAARASEVAAACGLEGSEVAAGLRSWAGDQVAHGLMEEWQAGVIDLMARTVAGES